MDVPQWLLDLFALLDLPLEEQASIVRLLRDQGELASLEAGEPPSSSSDLGQLLLSLGMLGEREALQAQAQETGLGFVDLDRVAIPPSAIAVVPKKIVKQHGVIPVKKEGETLWLAMTNDKNYLAIDDVRRTSGCRVIPVLAIPGAIDEAILRYY